MLKELLLYTRLPYLGARKHAARSRDSPQVKHSDVVVLLNRMGRAVMGVYDTVSRHSSFKVRSVRTVMSTER